MNEVGYVNRNAGIVPVERKGIEEKAKELDAVLAHAVEMLDELNNRLSVIMRDPSVKETVPAGSDRPAMSPMQADLLQKIFVARHISDTIQGILNRIDF